MRPEIPPELPERDPYPLFVWLVIQANSFRIKAMIGQALGLTKGFHCLCMGINAESDVRVTIYILAAQD
jgi:hypothetical protein